MRHLRGALKLPVQRPAHLIDKPADSHEIIDFGSPAVISGGALVVAPADFQLISVSLALLQRPYLSLSTFSTTSMPRLTSSMSAWLPIWPIRKTFPASGP